MFFGPWTRPLLLEPLANTLVTGVTDGVRVKCQLSV